MRACRITNDHRHSTLWNYITYFSLLNDYQYFILLFILLIVFESNIRQISLCVSIFNRLLTCMDNFSGFYIHIKSSYKMCSIANISTNPFYVLSYSAEKEIIKLGRLVPYLNITQMVVGAEENLNNYFFFKL